VSSNRCDASLGQRQLDGISHQPGDVPSIPALPMDFRASNGSQHGYDFLCYIEFQFS
jgi:hypothetical protein